MQTQERTEITVYLTEMGIDLRTRVLLLALPLSSCVSLSKSCHSPLCCASAPGCWCYQRTVPQGKRLFERGCGKVSGHCFQLEMLDARLTHTSCASLTFWNISARYGFVLKCGKLSSLQTIVRIWLIKNQLFSKHTILPVLGIPRQWHKMAPTFLPFLVFMLGSWLQRNC